MRILGIETSCDETAAAVIEDGVKILSNVVASSVELHRKTGGIIPEVAAREQIKFILPVIDEAIKQLSNKEIKEKKSSITQLLNYSITKIDAIAVTIGPGLIGSLLVGVETARTLAYVWQKPIIPVNHLIAHIYANWLNPGESREQRESRVSRTQNKLPFFPAIALVVSGGHTDLVLMKDHPSKGRGKLRWIGGTRDDAAGECFDKCARLLGLGYPGGPAIAAIAEKFEIRSSTEDLLRASNSKFEIKLPRPMMEEDNFDFSFSGLKTAVLREVNQLKTNQQYSNIAIQQLSYEIQEAITDVLVAKTIQAAEKFKVKSILLAGGVSANQKLREKILRYKDIKRLSGVKIFIPQPQLCTDNAVYIAACAYFNFKPVPWQKITTQPGLSIVGEI